MQNYTIITLTSQNVPLLRYRAHARKSKPLEHCTETCKLEDIDHFVWIWQINVPTEF